ncbi:MAG: Gfo/Idh/MocA family oxidoreductase [Phycisphaerales bacterium]
MNTSQVNVGVVGLGFIGGVHVRAYREGPASSGCHLVAVCDRDPTRLTGAAFSGGNIRGEDEAPLFDPGEVATHEDPAELLADERIDLVSVCTPTDTHVDLAIAALAAGKHVLVEKPVAIRAAEVERLAEAAAASDRLCVPAMCMRHWPGWDTLIELVRSGEFGRVLSARFERLGAPPSWSSFYSDVSRCGDALFDLHIHDVDMVHACFGRPTGVHSVGRPGHVATSYRFEGGPPLVMTEGGWLSDKSAAFRMRYVVEFERALADFDLRAEPTMSLLVGGEQRRPALSTRNGWERQAEAVVRAVASGDASGLPTLADALEVTRTLEAELESLRTERPVTIRGC